MPLGRPLGAKDTEFRRGSKAKILSVAYKKILSQVISEDLKQEMQLEDGSTYAEAIASNVVRRALGKVKDDQICFRAITEIRETTEGKTAEKIIAAGTNEELTNLARIMQGEPATADGDESEDSATEDAEVDFHQDNSHAEE